MFAAPAPTGGP